MKKHDNDIWATKVLPVIRRDEIAGEGGIPLSREINHARVCVLETFVLLERLSW